MLRPTVWDTVREGGELGDRDTELGVPFSGT